MTEPLALAIAMQSTAKEAELAARRLGELMDRQDKERAARHADLMESFDRLLAALKGTP